MNHLTQQAITVMEELPETMQAEILDFIQFLKLKLERSKLPVVTSAAPVDDLATVLERLAQRQAQQPVLDPRLWQQEIREDRILAGRD